MGPHFLSRVGFHANRERKREEQRPKHLSTIYGVFSVEVRLAKSESSSTQRGLRVGTKKCDFSEDQKEKVSGNLRFQVREASHLFYYATRGSDSSYTSFSSHFWVDFWVKNGGTC